MKDLSANLRLHVISCGEMDTNSYILYSVSDSSCIIIDPADGEEIEEYILGSSLKPKYIINTHGHYDHISGNRYLRDRFDVPICISAKDSMYLSDPRLNLSGLLGYEYRSPEADIMLDSSSKLELDNNRISFIMTPGHTPGSMCISAGIGIFSGDLVFMNGIGRTDLPGGNEGEIVNSLKNVFSKFKFDRMIYPGHGMMGKKMDFDDVLGSMFFTY